VIGGSPSLLLAPTVRAAGLLARALGAAAAREGRDAPGFLADLRAGDPGAQSAFRYALAREFCGYVSGLGSTFRAVYIYGSTMDGRTRPSSDVDIIAWVERKTDTVESLLERLNRVLTQGCRTLTGCGSLQRVFDIHLVDDEDVRGRRGYGSVIASVWTAPVCLWRR